MPAFQLRIEPLIVSGVRVLAESSRDDSLDDSI
jgi:hypothetical protein